MAKLGPKQSSVIRDPSAPRAGGLQPERRAHAVDSALISHNFGVVTVSQDREKASSR
jgi:hypothetical protein